MSVDRVTELTLAYTLAQLTDWLHGSILGEVHTAVSIHTVNAETLYVHGITVCSPCMMGTGGTAEKVIILVSCRYRV